MISQVYTIKSMLLNHKRVAINKTQTVYTKAQLLHLFMPYLKKKTNKNQHKIKTNKQAYSSFIKLEDCLCIISRIGVDSWDKKKIRFCSLRNTGRATKYVLIWVIYSLFFKRAKLIQKITALHM